MKRLQLFLFVSFALISCVEKFNIPSTESDPKIVIEATLTNDSTQCLVKITKSKKITNDIPSDQYLENEYEPVKDALVILTDDKGQTDTAVAINPESTDSLLDHKISVYYKYQIFFNYQLERWDTSFQNGLNLLWDEKRKFRGFYTTTRFVGVAGRSYKLYVKAEGKEYVAEANMPATVPSIDSIAVKSVLSEADGENYEVPFVYFDNEANQRNYYLISLQTDFYLRTAIGLNGLPVNLVNNEFLPSRVNGIPVLNEKDFYLNRYWGYQVFIYSLSEEAYTYYRDFFQQTNTDGGAYSPAPANLQGNFSNGALGFFRASAVKVKRIKPFLMQN